MATSRARNALNNVDFPELFDPTRTLTRCSDRENWRNALKLRRWTEVIRGIRERQVRGRSNGTTVQRRAASESELPVRCNRELGGSFWRERELLRCLPLETDPPSERLVPQAVDAALAFLVEDDVPRSKSLQGIRKRRFTS